MRQLTDCWDFDGTLVHTGRLFAPAIKRVADVSGKSVADVAESLGQVSRRTFTFTAWFADLGLEAATWAGLEAELRTDITQRAKDCLYPGVRQLIEARKRAGVQPVLITAGDPDYQQWKFEITGLGDLFAVEDRHFVPLSGSKADVIAKYLALGPVKFIDDKSDWHEEVLAKHPSVVCIRTRWPETSTANPHADDGKRWQTAETIQQLQELLERGDDE